MFSICELDDGETRTDCSSAALISRKVKRPEFLVPARVSGFDRLRRRTGPSCRTGTIARVRSAIGLHLSADEDPTALGPYRASTAGAQTPREAAREPRGAFTALFALRRASEPERGEDRATAKAGHRHGGREPLFELQEVAPHWKRQAHGPRHSRRRWIVIERYERGPAPTEDQIEVTRLAERQRRSPDRADAKQ